MKKRPVLFISLLFLSANPAFSQNVCLLYDQSVPQAKYVAVKLGEALEEQGYRISEERIVYDYLINIGVNKERLQEEAYTIIPAWYESDIKVTELLLWPN